MDDLTFAFLRSALGEPARTFSYAGSGSPDLRDHVWRCGCGARERARLCRLEPCAKHLPLRRDAGGAEEGPLRARV